MSEKGTTRNTTIFGTLIMLMWIVAVTRTREIAAQLAAGTMPIELFYIILLFILLFQALFFERDTGALVIDTSQWAPEQLRWQVPAGLGIGLAVAAPLALAGTPTPLGNFFSDVVTQALYVAFVETIFLIVVVKTWRARGWEIGIYVQPLLFGFMHAFVRDAWLAGQFSAESIAGFAYAALFGVFFEALYLARDHLPEKYARYFGAVTVWIVHITINTILSVVTVHAGSFQLFPLSGVGP